MKKSVSACLSILLLLASHVASGNPGGDCEGTPSDAVTSLPGLLGDWAQIVCSPYGHVIAPADGWIWTQPGTFAPVFIPSQMVRSDPKESGNEFYFSEIEFTEATDDERLLGHLAINSGLDEPEEEGKVYRLSVSNQDGKDLVLMFEVSGDGESIWGVWCGESCDPSTSFMLLDMTE